MTELLRHEAEEDDYEFEIEEEDRDARVLVMAPHGGGIEPGTTPLARSIAADDFVFYSFKGVSDGGNRCLHVTSTSFDEPEAVRLAEQAEVVLAVHGKSGDGEFVMVGGRHSELVDQVQDLLEKLEIETRDPTPRVAAASPRNICNRCQEGGVQLELSKPLRKRFKRDSDLRYRFVRRLHRLLCDAVSNRS